MLTVDATANTNRWRAIHPAEKAVPALILLVIILVRPPLPTACLALAATTAAATLGADIPLARWLRALAWPAGFVVSGAIGIALVTGDGPGPLPLTVTSTSLGEAGLTVLRSLAGVSAVLFIGMTTPMVDLISSLRALRVPVVVTDLMATTYRLMFELLETGQRLRISQAARLGHDGRLRSIRSTSLLAGAVFVQSVHRSRRLQTGLDARAYDGELRVLTRRRDLRPAVLATAIIAALVIGVPSVLWPAG